MCAFYWDSSDVDDPGINLIVKKKQALTDKISRYFPL